MPIPCRLFALSRREFAALLAAFVLSLPAVTARIYASDEVEYFSYLRSLWFDHDVSFENEYRYFYDHDVARAEGFHATFLEDVTDAGRRRNFGTIGCALLWSPFYAVGDVSARALRAAGRPVAVDGFSRPYVAAVAYGSAFYGFLAVLLSIGAARRLLSPDGGSPDLEPPRPRPTARLPKRASRGVGRSGRGRRWRRTSGLRASPAASWPGRARRCSSTCMSRRRCRTPARRSPSPCSSRCGCTRGARGRRRGSSPWGSPRR